MVLEYLGHVGYDRAVEQMKQQLRERREGKKAPWRPVGREMQEHVKAKMLKALDAGNRDEVMQLWQNFVPPLVRHTETAAKKLEFYLNIFFAVYAVHPINARPNPLALPESMRSFKLYLETDGAVLAVTPEFLAYYAMPYVPEIQRHPSFKDLFSIEWALALKTRLSDFLSVTPQFASEPRLLAICRSYRQIDSNGGGQPAALTSAATYEPHPVEAAALELEAMRERLHASELRASETRQEAAAREATMQRGTFEAIQLASDVLNEAAQAEAFDEGVLRSLETRLGMARERLGLGPTGGGGYGAGGYRSTGACRLAGGAEPPDPLGTSMKVMAALHYPAIKRALVEQAPDVPLILQALRWRLTKAARRQRKTALAQFIANDLLHEDVLASLLEPQATATLPEVREQALRLINLFASEAAGRTYLLSKSMVVRQLCALLRAEPADNIARQNALGALQKLSLRRAPQNIMIGADAIAWLVGALSEPDELCQYSVEYGTALLMNLSLRTAGKAKCASPALDILPVLSQLMESDSLQVRTYVNGTLYSILVRSELKEKAEEIGLPDSLRALVDHSDDTLARQINYILEQLESSPADGGGASDDEVDEVEEEADDEEEAGVDDEEVDLFAEAELDPSPSGGVSGEGLLCSRYIAGVAAAQQEAAELSQNDPHEAEVARRASHAHSAQAKGLPRRKYHSADEPLQRPATPGSMPPPPRAGESQGGSRPSSRPLPPLSEQRPPPSPLAPPPTQPQVQRPNTGAPADEVFALRSKVPRTPQVKTRAELLPLQATAKKSDRGPEGGKRAPPPGTGPL